MGSPRAFVSRGAAAPEQILDWTAPAVHWTLVVFGRHGVWRPLRLTVVAPGEHNETGYRIMRYRRLSDRDRMVIRSGRTWPFGGSVVVAAVP